MRASDNAREAAIGISAVPSDSIEDARMIGAEIDEAVRNSCLLP